MKDNETSEEDGCDKAVDKRYVVDWFVSDISLFDRIRSCTVGSWEFGGVDGSSRKRMIASRPTSVMPLEAAIGDLACYSMDYTSKPTQIQLSQRRYDTTTLSQV